MGLVALLAAEHKGSDLDRHLRKEQRFRNVRKPDYRCFYPHLALFVLKFTRDQL